MLVRKIQISLSSLFFFFNDTATTEIYTLSLHDALPIWGICGRPPGGSQRAADPPQSRRRYGPRRQDLDARIHRSEEHTSELQSQSNLVCRLLLEKKKKTNNACCETLYELTSSQPLTQRI